MQTRSIPDWDELADDEPEENDEDFATLDGDYSQELINNEEDI